MKRARTTFAMVVALTSVAHADAPKLKPVDISAFKDKLVVLTDATGGTYAVLRDPQGTSRVFYGEGSTLYRQDILGGSSDGDAWTLDTYSPRVWRSLRGAIELQADGTYRRYCADNEGDTFIGLTRLGDDAAKKVVAKSKFVSSGIMYKPYGLARDKKGVYYYVDRLTSEYGGKGYRLWIGKKGRMKQIPIADVSDDTGGAVFSTKTGDLHLAFQNDRNAEQPANATWVRGEKATDLVSLDTFSNTWLIHSELGIYKFLGSICENPLPPPNNMDGTR